MQGSGDCARLRAAGGRWAICGAAQVGDSSRPCLSPQQESDSQQESDFSHSAVTWYVPCRALATALDCVRQAADGRSVELLRKESLAGLAPAAAARVLTHAYMAVIPISPLPYPPLPLSPLRQGTSQLPSRAMNLLIYDPLVNLAVRTSTAQQQRVCWRVHTWQSSPSSPCPTPHCRCHPCAKVCRSCLPEPCDCSAFMSAACMSAVRQQRGC